MIAVLFTHKGDLLVVCPLEFEAGLRNCLVRPIPDQVINGVRVSRLWGFTTTMDLSVVRPVWPFYDSNESRGQVVMGCTDDLQGCLLQSWMIEQPILKIVFTSRFTTRDKGSWLHLITSLRLLVMSSEMAILVIGMFHPILASSFSRHIFITSIGSPTTQHDERLDWGRVQLASFFEKRHGLHHRNKSIDFRYQPDTDRIN